MVPQLSTSRPEGGVFGFRGGALYNAAFDISDQMLEAMVYPGTGYVPARVHRYRTSISHLKRWKDGAIDEMRFAIAVASTVS